MRILLILTFLFSIAILADTPPLGQVNSKTLDGNGAKITSTTVGPKQAIDVNLASGAVNANVTSSPLLPLYVSEVFSNTIIDPRNRNWTLSTSDQITAFQGGAPWSIALPTNASTSTLQTTANTYLNNIDQKLPTLGQKTASGSMAVVLATDQTPIPISGSITTTNSANGTPNAIAPPQATMVGGFDGTKLQALKVAADGTLQTTFTNSSMPVTGTVSVSNFPTNVSTSALQTAGNSSLSTIQTSASSIDSKTPALGQALSAASVPVVLPAAQLNALTPLTSVGVNNFPSSQTVNGSVAVSNLPSTQPVSALALPLPSGASTSALQSAANTSLASIDSKLTSPLTIGGTVAVSNSSFGISGSLPAGTNALGSITNTVFGSTQSGVWNVGLSTGSNVIGSIANSSFGISGLLPAFATTPTFNIGTGAFVDRTTAAAPYSNRLSDGTAFYDARSIRALTSSDVVTIANPTSTAGLALEAGHLASMDSTLALIKAKTDNIDVALSTRTKPADTQTVSGTVTSNIGTTGGLALESGHAASTDTSTAAINGKLTTTANGLKVDGSAVTQPVSGSVSISGTPTVSVSNFPATQNVAGTVTSNIGTTGGLALDSSVNTLLKPASTLAAVTSITNTVTVKADTAANQANALKVDASSTTSLPLPNGAASSANQTTELATLSTIATNTANTTVTQATGTNLHTVVDSGSITANAGTNLNTSALNLETTQSAMNSKIPTGLTVKAASTAALATDQALVVAVSPNNTIPISAASLPLPATASTSTLQTTANTSLASIDSKTTVVGQATMANSKPVVIASNQSAIPTSRTWNSLASTDSTAAWLSDGTGNAISSLTDGNGGKALEVAISSTGFVFSTLNSTTVQLAAGATFTGTIETAQNQQSISLLLTSDQNGTLTVNQYIDLAGTRKVPPIVIPIIANAQFSKSFPINGNYINVTFQNTGASATTTLNLNTAYGTIPSATAKGNAPTSLDEVNGTSFSLGQTTKALSLPVTIASDQTTSVGIKVDDESQVLDFSSTNLAAGATYTSPWFDTNFYGAGANLYYIADQPTTYSFEISPDQTNINVMDTLLTPASTRFQETQYIPTRYWRVKLTNNGASATTSLFLSSGSRKIPAQEYIKLGDRAGNDLSLVNNLTTTTTTNAVPVDIKPNIQNTYHASFQGAVTATTPTDVFTIAGAAGKKIRIKYVYVDGEQTTSGTIRVSLIKRSTLDTAGTSTTITPVASDPAQAASAATVRAYTANPTLGTAIGTFSTKLLRINVAGSTQTPVEFDTTNGSLKDMTLSSATEQVAINFNSSTIIGNLMAINVIYTEE